MNDHPFIAPSPARSSAQAYRCTYAESAHDAAIARSGLLTLRANWPVTPTLEIAGNLDNFVDKTYYTSSRAADTALPEDAFAQIAFTWTPNL